MSTTVVKDTGAWSYSALKNFETCPRRYDAYDWSKTIPFVETEQIVAGHHLHKHFENRLLWGTSLPIGYGMFEPMLAKVAAAPGTLSGEARLALTAGFAASPYFGPQAWFRTVVDACVMKPDGATATVFDWKTGRHKDEETQLQLMALALFIHHPALERVRAALVFVNYDSVHRMEFARGDTTELWAEILPRVRALMAARAAGAFPPKPSGLCRKYCDVRSCEFHGRGGR